MENDLSDLFSGLVREHSVPGAQLSVYREGALYELAEGVEHTGSGRLVTPASRFAYGSVSKIFTAALIMQLVEDGDLDLDAPLTGYLNLRGLPADHPAHATTPRQLLSHTAGLVSDHEADPARTEPLRHYAASLLRSEPVGAPESAFSYSNSGYVLAAHLVEAVTGQDWWETLESYLALPAGLDLAFVYDARAPRASGGLVSGHAVDTGSGRTEPVDFHIESEMAPAGGLGGSATTLVDFARAFMTPDDAVLDSDIADSAVLNEMGRAVPSADPFGLADGWGAGWALHLAADRFWYGHDGTLDGGTCNLRVDPVGRVAVALTTNGTTGIQLWEALVSGLGELGLDVGHYRQRAPVIRSQETGAEVTGHYANGDLAVEVTRHGDGALWFTLSNGFSGPLVAGANLDFSVTVSDLGDMSFDGRFLRASDNPSTITAMQYNGRVLRRTFAPMRSRV